VRHWKGGEQGLDALHEADLSEAPLSGANLNGAALTGAGVGAADRGRVRLIGAKLFRAELVGARPARAIPCFTRIYHDVVSNGAYRQEWLSAPVLPCPARSVLVQESA
jgi:hypothetical protein